MRNQVNSMNKGLTVRDLVTTGIFTALLFVFVLVGGVFFATNPVPFFMPIFKNTQPIFFKSRRKIYGFYQSGCHGSSDARYRPCLLYTSRCV